MAKIQKIKAREILDSRGNPTIEVDVSLEDGSLGRASVPSGSSTGTHEAQELRDGGSRYNGKGVLKAVENAEKTISAEIISKEFSQNELDNALIKIDGTSNKGNLGANTILGVSLAFAKASAKSAGQELWQYFQNLSKSEIKLPRPMMNIMNGGMHAGNKLDFQEFMIMPNIDKGFAEAVRMGSEIFHTLAGILKAKNLNTNVGDEGGFAPDLESNAEAVEFIIKAIEQSGFKLGTDINLAIDVAANSFYYDGKYLLATESKTLDADELIEIYKTWVANYPIISIEDGLHEDDWNGFKKMTEAIGDKAMVVGDDLFVTNIERLRRGIEMKAANAILVKLNQIGSITETIQTVAMAKQANYSTIISHRSGETEDTSIAHLAVGLGAGWIKTGSVSRSERTVKYNELMRIEEGLLNT